MENKKELLRQGEYLDIYLTDKDNIFLVPTQECIDICKQEMENEKSFSNTNNMLCDFLEDHCGNGWALMNGEELGLTDSMGITNDLVWNEETDELEPSYCWYDCYYMTIDPIAEFALGQEVFWLKHVF